KITRFELSLNISASSLGPGAVPRSQLAPALKSPPPAVIHVKTGSRRLCFKFFKAKPNAVRGADKPIVLAPSNHGPGHWASFILIFLTRSGAPLWQPLNVRSTAFCFFRSRHRTIFALVMKNLPARGHQAWVVYRQGPPAVELPLGDKDPDEILIICL